MTIQSLPLISSGDAKTDYRRIAETINQILAQGQFLIDDTPALITSTVYFKAAPLFKAGSYMIGLRCTWASDPDSYWLKIATLPISTTATGDSINVVATLNVGWAAADSWKVDIVLGNRGAFAYVWRKTGTVNANCAIKCYLESDGSVSVYAAAPAGAFSFGYIDIQNAGNLNQTVTLYPQPPFTTSPTGTLVFDSGDTTTYPPAVP